MRFLLKILSDSAAEFNGTLWQHAIVQTRIFGPQN